MPAPVRGSAGVGTMGDVVEDQVGAFAGEADSDGPADAVFSTGAGDQGDFFVEVVDGFIPHCFNLRSRRNGTRVRGGRAPSLFAQQVNDISIYERNFPCQLEMAPV